MAMTIAEMTRRISATNTTGSILLTVAIVRVTGLNLFRKVANIRHEDPTRN